MRSLLVVVAATTLALATAACAGSDGGVRIPADERVANEDGTPSNVAHRGALPVSAPSEADAGPSAPDAARDAPSIDASVADAAHDAAVVDAAIEDPCFDVALGRTRSAVKPNAGDLLISEWMPDPTAVTDAAGEWLELRATKDVDLNGLQIGNATLGLPIVSANCMRIAAGTFAVFARSTDPQLNGLGDVAVAGALVVYLPNASGTVSIGIDNVTLDTVSWTGAVGGVSKMIDGEGAACSTPSAVPPFNGKDIGTPGAPNGACP